MSGPVRERESISGLAGVERARNDLQTLAGVMALVLSDMQNVDTDGSVALYVVDRELGRIIDELETVVGEMTAQPEDT